MIEPGTTLLHYRIVEKIGEGGMGVVWRAVDTALDREVAIKVLPAEFAADADRLARFEREAKLLASLNHPGIAAVYGLHECDGVRFLAMELVAGEDLSRRLVRGALPVEDALEVGARLCEAFEAAHDAGVIHRDLKPANVMLAPDGRVKVLDFGLAKALIGDPASGSGARASMSPTMTSAGTRAGMILGTAAYMSPEQARGKPVDRRADVWALGCVLVEMLTGRAPFAGETVTDTLASVVRAEPDWNALPAATPRTVRRALRRALTKDPARRLRDAGDLRLEIEEALGGGAFAEDDADAARGAPASGRGSRLLWGLGGAVLTAIVLLAVWSGRTPPEREPGPPVRFEIAGAEGEGFVEPWSLAVSPDGRRIAWVRVDGVRREIRVRELDELEAKALPDTEGATNLTFSPDGRSVAFYAQGKLRRFDLGSRRAIDLCDTEDGAGLTWGPDGTIVFNSRWIGPLSKVSADGGEAEPASRLDPDYGEIGHWFPSFLPDGRHVLISRWRTSLNDMAVAVVSLETGTIRDLVARASFARFVPPDRLLFTRAGAIHEVTLDPERLEVEGEPVLVVDGVEQQWDNGLSPWAVAADGTMAYLPGGLWTTKRDVVRVARDGTERPLDVEPGAYVHVAMGPDGRRVALTDIVSGRATVLIRDLERGVNTTVPLDAVNCYPVWSPDGTEILFVTARRGPWDVWRYRVDGSSDPEPILEDAPDQVPLDWSRDGRFVLWDDDYTAIRAMEIDGDRTPRTVLDRGTDQAVLSPDGRWLAYSAAVGGRSEVFVRGFPDGMRDWQVSVDGGEYPLWSRDGRDVLYRRGDAFLAVSVRVVGGEWIAGQPRELFRDGRFLQLGRQVWSYDRTTDEMILIRLGGREISRHRITVVHP